MFPGKFFSHHTAPAQPIPHKSAQQDQPFSKTESFPSLNQSPQSLLLGSTSAPPPPPIGFSYRTPSEGNQQPAGCSSNFFSSSYAPAVPAHFDYTKSLRLDEKLLSKTISELQDFLVNSVEQERTAIACPEYATLLEQLRCEEDNLQKLYSLISRREGEIAALEQNVNQKRQELEEVAGKNAAVQAVINDYEQSQSLGHFCSLLEEQREAFAKKAEQLESEFSDPGMISDFISSMKSTRIAQRECSLKHESLSELISRGCTHLPKYFLRGHCKFGDQCINDHPVQEKRNIEPHHRAYQKNHPKGSHPKQPTFLSVAKADLSSPPVYSYSCYGDPEFSKENFVAGDVSPEELRLRAYSEIRTTGNLVAYFQFIAQLESYYRCTREHLIAGKMAANGGSLLPQQSIAQSTAAVQQPAPQHAARVLPEPSQDDFVEFQSEKFALFKIPELPPPPQCC